MEYFCDEKDAFWSQTDSSLIELAKEELQKLGLCSHKDIREAFVVRMPKAYPFYGLDYKKSLKPLIDFVGNFSNLQCIGRYGMFQYNNMDRSVYSGFLAAENILGKKNDLWSIDLDGPSG
jgi:protoporphyrinogen oxidase